MDNELPKTIKNKNILYFKHILKQGKDPQATQDITQKPKL